MAADRPVIIEAMTDLDVSPLLSGTATERARSFMFVLPARDSEAEGMIVELVTQMLEAFLPAG